MPALPNRPKEPPLATYAYLFETHDEKGHFWEGPNEVAYGAAEAIFVLTATGITTQANESMCRRRCRCRISATSRRAQVNSANKGARSWVQAVMW